MTWPWRLVVLLVLPDLSGCLDGFNGAAGPSDEGDAPGSMTITHTLSHCTLASVVIFRDRGDLQALLPDGFVAAKVEGPLPGTDVGVALLGVVSCAEASLDLDGAAFTHLEIGIEHPVVPGFDLGPSRNDRYFLTTYTDSDGWIHAFGPTGFSLLPASIVPGIEALPLGASVSGRVTDEAGEVLHLEGVAADEETMPLPQRVVRGWQVTKDGLVYEEWRRTKEMSSRPATAHECRARTGSPVADLFGGEDCTGPSTRMSFGLMPPGT